LSITHLTNEGIVEKLEEQRFDRLAKQSAHIKTQSLMNGRCPKCTLKLPCKHYESTEQLTKVGKLFKRNEWNSMNKEHRDAMIKFKLALNAD